MKCEKCGTIISDYDNFDVRYVTHMIISHGAELTDEWLDKNTDWITGETALKWSNNLGRTDDGL